MSFCNCSNFFGKEDFCAAIISRNDNRENYFHGNDDNDNAADIIRLLPPLELSEALTEQEISFLRYFSKVSNLTREDPVPSSHRRAVKTILLLSLSPLFLVFSLLRSPQTRT
jgi:hypothetical protein